MRKILILLALPLFACQKDPEVPEVDPVFAEKKRPPYNHVVLEKVKMREHDEGYQEVNPNFANDYQDAQREFAKQEPKDIVSMQNQTQPEVEALTVQKIRDDAKVLEKLPDPAPMEVSTNDTFQSPVQDVSSIEPKIPQKPISDGFDKIPQSASTPDAPPVAKSLAAIKGIEKDSPVQNDTESLFEIQAGSYKNPEGANKIVQKLKNAGVQNIRIDEASGIHTIRITSDKPLRTRAEASQFLQEIIEKTQHYDIMVVKK